MQHDGIDTVGLVAKAADVVAGTHAVVTAAAAAFDLAAVMTAV
eukprot:CAMPEP_0172440950 /NCGR_PEP_ID=MMETSP1065-20121228/1560_1 /TAXON_ID=265537 /ORGANISM="Amphiprora paludosa, Strain CCMP125" /LENGTH=42 /DNA_ID= /DNA_START= /DNA_END= /DNA_ORIENTATION=